MTYYISLRKDSDHFLSKCLDLFPGGIPVTTREPLNDFDVDYKDWAALSLFDKLKDSFSKLRPDPPFRGTLSKSLEPWKRWLFPKTRVYFYLLDSKVLDTHQYQAVKREFLNPNDPLDKVPITLDHISRVPR